MDSISQDIPVKRFWTRCKMNTQNLSKVCESFWYVILKDRTVTCWLLHYGQVVTYCVDVTLLIRPQKKKVSH